MKSKNRQLALTGMFTAMVLVFGLVPQLGFITLGVVAITPIPFIILIAAFLLDFKTTVWLSFLFGWTSLFAAYTRASGIEAIAFMDPRVSVLPRIIWGVIIGLVVKLINEKSRNYRLAVSIAAPLLNLVHATLVLFMFGFLYQTDALLKVLSLIVATNSLLETALALFVVRVVMPLKKLVKEKYENN